MTLYMTTSTIAAIVAYLLGPWVWKLLKSKKKLIILSMISYFAGFFLCYLIVLFKGSISNLTFLIIINIAIILFDLHGAIKPTIYMDVAEYGYNKTGKDALPFMMSFTNVSFKIAIAVSGGALGLALSSIGYVAGAEATPELVKSLTFIVMAIPSFCFLIAGLIFIFGYKLTDEKVKELMEENNKRREKIAS